MGGTKGILVVVALVVAVVAAYIFMFYLPKVDEINELREVLDKKKGDMAEKQQIAKDKERFILQLEELNERLGEALSQLPNEKEIAEMLNMLAENAQVSGIDLQNFTVRPESARELYSEVPIDLQIKGQFHNIAIFFDKISQQKRIINISNVKLGNPNTANGETVVTATCTATAFRFVEQRQAPKGKRAKTKG